MAANPLGAEIAGLLPAEAIRALLAAKAAALRGRDADALAALLDPEFLYVNASGRRFDQAGYVDAYCTSGQVVFLDQVVETLQVTGFGGFAVADFILHDHFSVAGDVQDARYRSLGVFRQAAAGWLWVAGQTMVTAPTRPPAGPTQQ